MLGRDSDEDRGGGIGRHVQRGGTLATHSSPAKAIVWTAKAEAILEKVRRVGATLENVHLNEALR